MTHRPYPRPERKICDCPPGSKCGGYQEVTIAMARRLRAAGFKINRGLGGVLPGLWAPSCSLAALETQDALSCALPKVVHYDVHADTWATREACCGYRPGDTGDTWASSTDWQDVTCPDCLALK